MTSKISSTKILRNFINQNTGLVLISTVLTAGCTLVPLLIQILSPKVSVVPLYYLYENSIMQFFALLVGFINAITVFKYLNVKSEVDFYHSLPIKRKDMFFTRYLTGILTFLIPFLVIVSATIIIGLNYQNFNVVDVIISNINTIIVFLATFAFTSLSAMISGNIFMTVCISLGLMNFLSIWISLYNALCTSYLDFYTYNTSLSQVVSHNINPFTAISANLFGVYHGTEIYIYIGLLITAILLSALAFIIYKKRNSENASNPVAVDVFKPIIKFIGVFSASIIGGILLGAITWNDDSILVYFLGAFIAGFIIHIAFEMLYELDVKAGFKNMYQFAIIYIIVVLTALPISMDMFNYADKISDINDIKSIEYYGIEITDPENIAILYDYMQASIEYKNTKSTDYIELNQATSGRSWLDLTVNLNDDSSYTRDYDVVLFPLEHIKKIETGIEFINKGYNYNKTLEEIEKMGENAIYIAKSANVYEDITVQQLLDFYKILQTEMHLITPEYLDKNKAVMQINITSSREYIVIPVFEIQEKTLEYLKPVDVGFDYMYVNDEVVNDADLMDKIAENMTVSYGAYFSYGYLHQNTRQEEIVDVYNENWQKIGYIDEEILKEIYN